MRYAIRSGTGGRFLRSRETRIDFAQSSGLLQVRRVGDSVQEQPMGWWIFVSGLIFVVAAILACSSVLAANDLARGALDMIAILSGMVCVGLGEGV
jgi:hypothetical protein